MSLYMFDPQGRSLFNLAASNTASPLDTSLSDDLRPRPHLEIVPKTIFETQALSVAEVIAAVCEEGHSHVVQQDGLAFEQELAASDRMIMYPDEYFTNPIRSIFGADKEASLLSFSLSLDASEKKHRLLEELTGLLTEVKGAKRIMVQALSMADELYTNASKNAWNSGDAFYVDPPRRQGRIDFIAAADGERLILCCRDSFGLLSIPKLLQRLQLCSRNGIADSISTNSPGAGIGAFLTFDSSVAYYAGVRAGYSTVVCAALPLNMSGAVYPELPKNIHLIA